MFKNKEKIILGVIFIAILSINSFFIFGLAEDKTQTTNNNVLNQISLEQAKTIALGVTDGTVTEAVLEKKRDEVVYEIEITNNNLKTDVSIDPANGNIINIENDEEETVTPEELRKIESKISQAKAKEIALNEVDGRIIKIETEKENGILQYAIEINTGNDIVDIEINAETGKVLKVEWDDED